MRSGETSVRVTAIVVAAGSGSRMGGATPKQYLPLRGAPILVWSATAFERAPEVDETILVVPPADLSYVADSIVDAHRLRKVRRVVPGGTSRQESTAAGLAVVEGEDGVVLVHDGVRPFVSARIVAEAAARAAREGAALVAVPVVDTIKRLDDAGRAAETISRDSLRAAQTPQAFRVDVLRRALEAAARDGFVGTDEATLVERMGIPVPIVDGDAMNIKITTPEDLARAETIAAGKEAP